MNTTKNDAPCAQVKRVIDADGNITHCQIIVGEHTIDASFSQDAIALESMVKNASGISLTITALMEINHASRNQMERESERLKVVLQGMPFGSVAKVDNGLSFWITTKGDLVWTEWMSANDSPGEIFPGGISEIGPIDTDELYAVAAGIRSWLTTPSIEVMDEDWLRNIELVHKTLTTANHGHPGKPVFAPQQINATVKSLQERSTRLAEMLEWVEDSVEAEPLVTEQRIISATLAAIKAEYAPGYFD